MKKLFSVLLVSCAVGLSACDSLGQAVNAHQDVVARAAGHEFSVDEAAGVIAANPRLPAQQEVVSVITNLWVDYVLLATAAREDSTLQNVGLDALLEPQFDQRILFDLRDSVIQADTAISEEELRAVYEEEQPGAQVRARHILLRVPADATEEQRDSIMRLAAELRDRARGGADFAELASEYSEDPGSARQGGDLGFFTREQMVPPFADAAFALEPGEVSDVVESPFGLHIIKVEERRTPEFGDLRDQLTQQLRAQRQAEAESLFVSELRDESAVSLDPDAAEITKELAGDPARVLGRASDRELVSYPGGAFTAGELQQIIRFFPEQQRQRIQGAPDEIVETALRRFADNEILLDEAERLGIGISEQARDSARVRTRTALVAAARQAGLLNVQPQDGETPEQAIERRVNTLLNSIARQERPPLMLGALSYALRAEYDAEVMERAFPAVVRQVEESRPAQSVTPGLPNLPNAAPQGQPQAPQGQPQAPQMQPQAPTGGTGAQPSGTNP